MSPTPIQRAAVAEFIGTAFLLIAVIGSGIAADRLSDDVGLVLFQNAFATAGALLALISAFAMVSGAHFNPAVTVAEFLLGGLDRSTAAVYVVVQIVGACTGAVAANLMFDLDAVTWSTTDRSALHLVGAEVIATIGLLLVIHGAVRSSRTEQPAVTAVALAVAGYIGGAYYFTSSTSFANPAVTVARTLSDTFAGIDPTSAPGFVAAQVAGTVIAVVLIRVLWVSEPDATDP